MDHSTWPHWVPPQLEGTASDQLVCRASANFKPAKVIFAGPLVMTGGQATYIDLRQSQFFKQCDALLAEFHHRHCSQEAAKGDHCTDKEVLSSLVIQGNSNARHVIGHHTDLADDKECNNHQQPTPCKTVTLSQYL